MFPSTWVPENAKNKITYNFQEAKFAWSEISGLWCSPYLPYFYVSFPCECANWLREEYQIRQHPGRRSQEEETAADRSMHDDDDDGGDMWWNAREFYSLIDHWSDHNGIKSHQIVPNHSIFPPAWNLWEDNPRVRQPETYSKDASCRKKRYDASKKHS